MHSHIHEYHDEIAHVDFCWRKIRNLLSSKIRPKSSWKRQKRVKFITDVVKIKDIIWSLNASFSVWILLKSQLGHRFPPLEGVQSGNEWWEQQQQRAWVEPSCVKTAEIRDRHTGTERGFIKEKKKLATKTKQTG